MEITFDMSMTSAMHLRQILLERQIVVDKLNRRDLDWKDEIEALEQREDIELYIYGMVGDQIEEAVVKATPFTFSEMYRVDELRKQIPGIVDEVRQLMEADDIKPQQGETMYMIDCITPDAAGIYQPNEIVDAWGLDVDFEDEYVRDWIWDEIDRWAMELTEQAQDAIGDLLPDWLGVGFGNMEFCSDYGLILWYEEV